MSLLIDALKKHRAALTSSVAQSGGDALKNTSSGKAKKLIMISLVTVIVITLTATISFLIFKHIEKKRMAEVLHGKLSEVQKIKERLESQSGGASVPSEDSTAPTKLRETLREKIQQSEESQTSMATPPAVSETNNEGASNSNTSIATSAESPREQLSERRKSEASAQTQTVNDSNDDTASQDASDSDSTSSDESTDQDNSGDSGDSDDSDSETTKSKDVSIDVKATVDPSGVNNPTYQKALEFMQANQYDKALALLENKDDLLLKTQGLSALLLARIYLDTGEYELADQILDRALLLHVGSEMDLLGLKAQALFMQKKYQEAVDVLSAQSPDLSTSPEYYALLANAYMNINQADNAVSVFQQIVSRFPNSADYWLGLAVAYQKTGDATSAAVAYRRAAQLSADNPQVTIFINQQLQALQVL